MIRLSLWYLRRLLAQRVLAPPDLARALTTRVNLYGLTTLWNGVQSPALGHADPAWAPFASELSRCILAARADDTSRLEEEGLSVLWPVVEGRLPLDVGPPCRQPFGCWVYEPAWDGLGTGPGLLGKLRSPFYVAQKLRRSLGLRPAPCRGAVLHFENAFVPDSPFTRAPALQRSLRALIAACRRDHPSARTLWCNTWLNSHPAFLALFPASWRRSGVPSEPAGDYSWWGQFVTRTVDFNERAAERFRASGGQFPYPALLCHASIDEVDAHLAGMGAPEGALASSAGVTDGAG